MTTTLRGLLFANVAVLGLIVALDHWPVVWYAGAILADADYANDWLTHLPEWSRDGIALAGRWLAVMTRPCPPC